MYFVDSAFAVVHPLVLLCSLIGQVYHKCPLK